MLWMRGEWLVFETRRRDRTNSNKIIFNYLATWHTVFLQSDTVATIYFAAHFVRLLFEGSILFLWKAWRHQWWLDRVRTSETVTVAISTVSSTRSLSVLLSAVGTTRTTQTVLALAWWPSSEIIHAHTCMCAAFTSHSHYSGQHILRASDCAATGVYSKKYSNHAEYHRGCCVKWRTANTNWHIIVHIYFLHTPD